MNVLLCTGDSHTWGQGADGLCMKDMPELFGTVGVCAGDLRPVPFDRTECYVGRLRKSLSGCAREYPAGELAALWGSGVEGSCARLNQEAAFIWKGGLIRIFLKKESGGSVIRARLDGALIGERCLNVDEEAWNGSGMTVISARCGDGEHALILEAEQALVYRIETYEGPWAVVNAGIGSCPVRRYLDDYWADYVADCRPDVLLMEAHTINDWLRPQTAEAYEAALTEMLERAKELNARVLLLTVSPVMGRQESALKTQNYSEFIEASRRAAERAQVEMIDANRVMTGEIAGLTEEEAFDKLFEDDWHVNSRGHEIYAELSMKALFGKE